MLGTEKQQPAALFLHRDALAGCICKLDRIDIAHSRIAGLYGRHRADAVAFALQQLGQLRLRCTTFRSCSRNADGTFIDLFPAQIRQCCHPDIFRILRSAAVGRIIIRLDDLAVIVHRQTSRRIHSRIRSILAGRCAAVYLAVGLWNKRQNYGSCA